MDPNKTCIWAGNILACALYLPLLVGIFRGKIEQSFATWILWVSLDAIAMVSMFLQDGNYSLLVCYVIGGSVVTAALVYTKQFKWTGFESFILFLVIVCLVAWYTSGSKWATVASTLAVVISGAPQVRESWHKPDKTAGFIYLGYMVANFLSFCGGKSWSVEERFYAGCMVFLCATISTTSFRSVLKRAV